MILCLTAAVPRNVDGNIQMSLRDMETSLLAELKVVSGLQQYVNNVTAKTSSSQQSQIKTIRRYIREFKDLTSNVHDEGFDNPVHAYLLLKHMTSDFDDVTEALSPPDGAQQLLLKNITEERKNGEYPTNKDLDEAALSLVRLQSTYNITTNDVITGNVWNYSQSTTRTHLLTASDCFRLGTQAVLGLDLQLAAEWFEEGLKRADKEPVNNDTREAAQSQLKAIKNILEYGNVFEGLMSQAVKNAPSYILDIANFIPGLPPDFFKKMKVSLPSDGHVEYSGQYKQLCQGKTLLSPEVQKHLVCALIRGKHQRFTLAPNKLEILSYDPVVVIYHDVLSDREADYLKASAYSDLEVPKTKSSQDLEEGVSFRRTGKMAFLTEADDPYLQKLTDRIEDITGIDTTYAESWQVVNYGIGGHYETHFDYYDFDKRNISFPGGDRMGTMLFYLNDVASGGRTVFPILGIGYKPEKGSALFWYNLRRNGEGDPRTIHAACPILSGTKWIANKWLHSHGNEFLRPCADNWDE
ncbi:P4HA2 (predicted) [Pycnogonum litorale]